MNWSILKSDMLEMVENRKSTRDMKLLKDIAEWVGLGETFDFDDYSRLRTIKTRRGYRCYYGKANIKRLIENGFVEIVDDDCFELTIKGDQRVNFIELNALEAVNI